MLFGLTHVPATFCRLVDAMFGPEFEPNVFVYLDEIIVVSATYEEYLHFCSLSSGHMGIEKNIDRVVREYYWKGHYGDVVYYVPSCDLCQRYKVSQQAGRRAVVRCFGRFNGVT